MDFEFIREQTPLKAAEKNAKRRAHYNHLERAVDAEAAKRFQEQTAL